MKLRAFATVLALGMLLSGCGTLIGGEYIWTEAYQPPQSPESFQQISVTNYLQLQKILTDMVEKGENHRTVSVAKYKNESLEEDMARAEEMLRRYHPIGSYALNDIECELGSIAGQLVMVIRISYRHDRVGVGNIQHVADISAARQALETALESCQSSVVLEIQDYVPASFAQMVEAYALENPHIVMELPQVVENIYPETGRTRVVEIKLHYQSSRDSLINMQNKVAPIFSLAVLHVDAERPEYERYSALYTFLMERYEYTIKTSITPAYSLLRHGVGDNKAFAMVYAAMCRMADLECLIVSGTHNGESHYWNIVCVGGTYYHLDLLHCDEKGGFQLLADGDMAGYVWDYSAYPACGTK